MVQKVAVAAKKLEIVQEICTSELPAALLSHPVLAAASPASLTALSTHFDVIKISAGAALYRCEARCDRMFFLLAGTVQTLHHNAASETVESDWVSGPAVLAVHELFSGAEGYSETAMVQASGEAIAIPMSVVRQLIARDAAFALALAQALARRHSQALLNERATLDSAFVRVARYLQTLVQRGSKEVAPELFLLRVTQDDIASATGLNPRTVARAMKALQQKGRLYVRRGEYLLRQPMSLVCVLSESAEATSEA